MYVLKFSQPNTETTHLTHNAKGNETTRPYTFLRKMKLQQDFSQETDKLSILRWKSLNIS